MIVPQLREAAAHSMPFQVVSQDDPQFPGGVASMIDDRALDISWLNAIEATPTLIRYKDGLEVERVMGWDRAASDRYRRPWRWPARNPARVRFVDSRARGGRAVGSQA